jgi:hypothetical protein
MALTESQRNRIAQLKIRIESYRKDLERLSQRKKNNNSKFASLIKNTTDASQKRNYRQNKISETNTVVNEIARKKHDIDQLKIEITNIKK